MNAYLLLSKPSFKIYNKISLLRADGEGCVESCSHDRTAAGNPTYKQKD